MDLKDYYAIMGVSPEVGESELRQAYRRLARQYHPDLHPDDSDAASKFREINEAYEVLADAEHRRRYDALRRQWSDGPAWRQRASGATTFDSSNLGFGGAASRGDPFAGGRSPDVDFFEFFFGDGNRARRPQRGADLELVVEISLAEAYVGVTRRFSLRRGDGSVHEVELEIPAGTPDGTVLISPGEGHPGRYGGPSGDLYVIVSLRPDPQYVARGADLYTRSTMALETAVLGGAVSIPTPAGSRTATVPPEAPDGYTVRLQGAGLLRTNGGCGDIIVELHVEIPQGLSPAERAAFQTFAALRRGDLAVTSPGAPSLPDAEPAPAQSLAATHSPSPWWERLRAWWRGQLG